MYKEKGLIKVFNGEKFKTVSYLKEDNNIIFTTGNHTKKYSEIKNNNNKMRVLIDNVEKEYDVIFIEDTKAVDQIFAHLKATKAIPFFIPRKNKIVIKYEV